MNKRYIHITKADRDFIAKALNVTEKTVYNAIRFDDRRGNSELSAKIRKLAMDRGGIVMVVIPEIETFHDYDNVMRQTVKTYEHVMVADINQIQAFASALR